MTGRVFAPLRTGAGDACVQIHMPAPQIDATMFWPMLVLGLCVVVSLATIVLMLSRVRDLMRLVEFRLAAFDAPDDPPDDDPGEEHPAEIETGPSARVLRLIGPAA